MGTRTTVVLLGILLTLILGGVGAQAIMQEHAASGKWLSMPGMPMLIALSCAWMIIGQALDAMKERDRFRAERAAERAR